MCSALDRLALARVVTKGPFNYVPHAESFDDGEQPSSA